MADLYDLMQQGFSPTTAQGGFFDNISNNRNALIGLGMGLMSGTKYNPYGNVMQGFAQGAQQDSLNKYRQMALLRQQQESERAQANADRSYALRERELDMGRMPAGFQRRDDGSLGYIPGGPADPAYIKSAAEGRQQPRQLGYGDISKMDEEGGKYAQINTFANTFEPRFAGYKSNIIGQAANAAGRSLPEGVVGKDVSEGAAWWQQYDRYRNVVRHDLYGTALSRSEQNAFEAADANPGMEPAQIQKNLAAQQKIVQAGIERKAKALIAAGYDPAVISKAYGLDNAPGRTPVKVSSPGEARKLPRGTPILLPDGTEGVVP